MKGRLFAIIPVIVGASILVSPDSRAGPCARDLVRLCKGVKPGEGRVVRCLWKHRAELSAECKEKARRDWENAMQISSDCAADARKFCQGVLPGKGRIAACLFSHKDELSPQCKTHATKAAEGLKKAAKGIEALMLGACKADRSKFCQGVKPGKRRIVDCLSGHRAKLRPACRRKLDRIQKRK